MQDEPVGLFTNYTVRPGTRQALFDPLFREWIARRGKDPDTPYQPVDKHYFEQPGPKRWDARRANPEEYGVQTGRRNE